MARIGVSMKLLPLFALLLLLSMPAAQPLLAAAQPNGATGNPIKHVVVIVQENHSFDNYFGTFPGANGIQNDPPTVHPFHITGAITDLCHSTICAHEDYDNGKMDDFLQGEGSNQTFGYYDQSDIPYYWSLAQNYTLFDNYFTAAMGPSLPNHLYLVAGQDDGVADSIGGQLSDLNINSIANELEAANDSWAYYSPYTVGNENALGLVSSVVDNNTMSQNMKLSEAFFSDLVNGKMPDVSYIMADDGLNEHPPYPPSEGEAWTEAIIKAIQASPYWDSTAILVTWDDYGGWYDHVVPPKVDDYGDGFRVPLLMVSPFAKHGFVDDTLSDHTSILKFIERVFGLAPLTQRDGMSSDLMEAMNSNYDALTTPFVDDSITMQGTPTYSNMENLPFLDAYSYAPSVTFTYVDNLSHYQTVVFMAALRNGENQTVQLARMREGMYPGDTTDVQFTFHDQAAGIYTINIVAMSPQGAALSEPFRLLLNSSDTAPSMSS